MEAERCALAYRRVQAPAAAPHPARGPGAAARASIGRCHAQRPRGLRSIKGLICAYKRDRACPGAKHLISSQMA